MLVVHSMQAFKAMWDTPTALSHILQMPSGAAFLSSTPECLYTRTDSAVASEAVAGTRARGAGAGLGLRCTARWAAEQRDAGRQAIANKRCCGRAPPLLLQMHAGAR